MSRIYHGLILLSIVSLGQAQRFEWKSTPPEFREHAALYQHPYDPKEEIQVKGTVVRVDPLPSLREPTTSVHVWIRSPTGVFEVHLGPQFFIDQQKLNLRISEPLDVIGVIIGNKAYDERVMLARMLVYQNRTIELRQPTGEPFWKK